MKSFDDCVQEAIKLSSKHVCVGPQVRPTDIRVPTKEEYALAIALYKEELERSR